MVIFPLPTLPGLMLDGRSESDSPWTSLDDVITPCFSPRIVRIITSTPLPLQPAERIFENFQFHFRGKIAQAETHKELDAIRISDTYRKFLEDLEELSARMPHDSLPQRKYENAKKNILDDLHSRRLELIVAELSLITQEWHRGLAAHKIFGLYAFAPLLHSLQVGIDDDLSYMKEAKSILGYLGIAAGTLMKDQGILPGEEPVSSKIVIPERVTKPFIDRLKKVRAKAGYTTGSSVDLGGLWAMPSSISDDGA